MSLAALDVTHAIERLNDFLDEFRPFAENSLDNINRRLGKAGRVRVLSIVEHVA